MEQCSVFCDNYYVIRELRCITTIQKRQGPHLVLTLDNNSNTKYLIARRAYNAAYKKAKEDYDKKKMEDLVTFCT